VRRPVAWDSGEERCDTAIFERDALVPGSSFAGPAIVLQPDSTVAVPPGAQANVDAAGNITIGP
jgi:N-methylhydantoinase A